LFEWSHDQLVYLIAQALEGNSSAGRYQWDEDRSELGVLERELDGEGGENEADVAPILEVS
jgi:hypothetical protein